MKEFKFEFLKGGGPGGQSVNKTESACRVTHVPSGIQSFNQDSRDQDHNKKRAFETVKAKLFKIEHDKYYEELGKKRRVQMGTTDRSDKIRTYNFPQDRITDHRIGLTKYGIQQFLNGEMIDEFVEAFQEKVFEDKVNELMFDESENCL